MSVDRIRIEGIRGAGYHGVLPEERRDGQVFIVDVELMVDLRKAGASDALHDTVDYSGVAAGVLSIIEGEPMQLIESLAARIAEAILADVRVDAVGVTVHKPQAPVGVPVSDVSVLVTRP